MEDYCFCTPQKQVYGYIVDMIIPTNLVYVLFDPAIPTSSFNYIQLFLIFVSVLFYCSQNNPSYMICCQDSSVE